MPAAAVAGPGSRSQRSPATEEGAGPLGWSRFCSSSLEEQSAEVALTVQGTIPPWLNGAFVKNAAGRYKIGNRSLGNLQDGFAKVYRWRFDGGGGSGGGQGKVRHL